MSARCRTCDNRIPWHYVGFWGGLFFMVAGLVAGVVLGTSAYDAGKYRAGVRESVRDACIAGNENACRIYQVDYSSEGGW